MNPIRSIWLLAAGLMIAAIVWACIVLGWPATIVAVVFACLPDIALIGAFAEHGRLKPRRVGFYNLLHAPMLGAMLVAAGLAILALPPHTWIAALAGLAWLAHIAVDRACGFGLRAADGSIVPVGVRRDAGSRERKPRVK
ncbi:DUF4260 family protein [Leucobacter soli]|uniref:DUF4260 family protein n=1 Tax=Leucobacter soli TaxID=2812850 RepID=A0A916JRR5_9MICO|nr:DUF4260 family protein [Leucobacter soli]CAG7598405.1 hypothetical protein LEUCIP111803_00221 [Leucobacter soli]